MPESVGGSNRRQQLEPSGSTGPVGGAGSSPVVNPSTSDVALFNRLSDRISRMGDKQARREVGRLLSLFVSVEDVADDPAHVRLLAQTALHRYREGALP